MRKLFAVVAALVLVLPLIGSAANDQKVASFAIRYDLDSATFVYPAMVGQGGPFGTPYRGVGMIKTVGSTTTVTEVVTNQLPFTDLAVGDVLEIQYGSLRYRRVITAKASGASITVDAAVDLSNNATFNWWDLQVGAADTDGWIPVVDLGSRVTLTIQYNAGDLTGGLDVIWQCKTAGPDAAPIQVYPPTGVWNLAAPGASVGTGLVVTEEWSVCRLGIKAQTGDPGDPTVEQITAHLIGR